MSSGEKNGKAKGKKQAQLVNKRNKKCQAKAK